MNWVEKSPSATRHLTRLYITVLSTIALLALIGQVVIQFTLQQQSSDALVINVAGRQRMLSQRLSKAALTLDVFSDPTLRRVNIQELVSVSDLWQHSQEGLLHGNVQLGLPGHNSTPVLHLFTLIDTNYDAMLHASQQLSVILTHNIAMPSAVLLPFIQTILANQSNFLQGMDRIVQQYQNEAQDHVLHMREIELILFSLTMVVLLLEGLFVFRPAAQRIHQTLIDLIRANERVARAEVTRKKAERILALNEALASSQQSTPHARIVALGHYQVRGKEGIYYNVYHREDDGQQLFVCECHQYGLQGICPHSLAAAALHSVSGFQQL
jgi:Type IV pili methyl-accepting chemotaxis transducer N-term